jgi:uncharacterized protein
MTSVGLSRTDGQVLVGWPHVAQSITTIVTTELGERVQRRDFGARVPGLIDRPQNEETILDFFITIAEALEPRFVEGSIYGEPRFILVAVTADMSTPGYISLGLTGDYLPDGHRQTTRGATRQQLRIPINAVSLQQ